MKIQCGSLCYHYILDFYGPAGPHMSCPYAVNQHAATVDRDQQLRPLIPAADSDGCSRGLRSEGMLITIEIAAILNGRQATWHKTHAYFAYRN